METKLRRPAVAGTFYPADKKELAAAVDEYIDSADEPDFAPRAVVAPHAGYVYSGPVAGYAYRALRKAGDVKRIVIAGPAHRRERGMRQG